MSTTLPSPAYTAVEAKQTLARNHAPPMKAADDAPSKSGIVFPQAVRDYVSRSFDEDVRVPGMEKRTIEMKLKDVITHYAQRGLLEQVDWANYPLPQTLLLEEARRPTHSSEWAQTPEAHAPASPSSATNTANFWPRKRKSPDDDARRPEDDVPPWKRNNHQRTAKQNDKRRRNEAAPSPGPSKFDRLQMDQRKKRFESFQPASPAVSLGTHVMDHEPQLGPVVGTCQDLEKAYFRLTAPPRAETVRPQAVLERTLEHLKAKWCAERNYDYICNQFKSMRQDLTVQHIQSAFTVKVYEQHARVALEMGDMGEYNQCQTQLRALYSQDLGGHPEEFLAYRILYLIYTCNTTHLNDLLADLTPEQKKHSVVSWALQMRSALATGNYHKFFWLYMNGNDMDMLMYMADMFIERERVAALAKICIAYRPRVKVEFAAKELGFETTDECTEFICNHQGERLLERTDDGVFMQTAEGRAVFERQRIQAFRRVDIKGQM